MYEIFKRLMEERGITAYKVSKDTGISSQTLSAWKKDIYTPKREKMELLADYFDVSVDYLMGRTPFRQPPETPLPPENEQDDHDEYMQKAMASLKILLINENDASLRFMENLSKMDEIELKMFKQTCENIAEMQKRRNAK